MLRLENKQKAIQLVTGDRTKLFIGFMKDLIFPISSLARNGILSFYDLVVKQRIGRSAGKCGRMWQIGKKRGIEEMRKEERKRERQGSSKTHKEIIMLKDSQENQ